MYDLIRETLQSLTPELLDNVIDAFFHSAQTQVIYDPTEYLKAAILKAPKNAAIMGNTKAASLNSSGRPVSYDIDEYARLSMERLMKD